MPISTGLTKMARNKKFLPSPGLPLKLWGWGPVDASRQGAHPRWPLGKTTSISSSSTKLLPFRRWAVMSELKLDASRVNLEGRRNSARPSAGRIRGRVLPEKRRSYW